jgi:hypothetical protein
VATSGARRTSAGPAAGAQLATLGAGPPRPVAGSAAFACGIPSSG